MYVTVLVESCNVSEQAARPRGVDGGTSAGHLELAIDAVGMRLDRAPPDPDTRGDLTVGLPRFEARQHLELTRGKARTAGLGHAAGQGASRRVGVQHCGHAQMRKQAARATTVT